jgi:CBS domain-containing protein
MDERRVGAVLVTDADDHLVGIFTGRDAVRMLAQRRAAESPLGTVMTRSPDTLPPGRTAMDALRLMQDSGFRHVPVVDRGRAVGVMSWGDFRPSEHDRLDIETTYWERI